VALLLAWAAQALAQETLARGSTSARLESIGNPRLTVPAGDRALRLTLGAEGSLAGRSDWWDATLSGGVARNFSEEAVLDTTDGFAALRLSRFFERDTLSASAQARRDSTQSSTGAPSGVVLSRTQRNTYSGGAGWSRSVDERLSASGDFTLTGVRYDHSDVKGLVDTDAAIVSAGLSYALDKRATLTLNGRAGRTDTDPFTTRTESIGGQLGGSYQFSERLSAQAAFGPSRTRLESASLAVICPAPQELCDSGQVPFQVLPATTNRTVDARVYSAGASWRAAERTTVSASASRSINPTGSGVPTLTDVAALVLAHRFDDYLSLSADATYTNADALGDIVAAKTRTERVSATLNWALEREWSLDTGAWYARYQLQGGAEPKSNGIFVGLRYQPREGRL